MASHLHHEIARAHLHVVAILAAGRRRGHILVEIGSERLPQIRGEPAADFGTVAAVGRVLYGTYTLQFEAVSLLLLVAIVAAVVVAKGRI